MQAWWRVLRGVYPYRWSIILSMICALGVGLSYASGVAVMLPVMKIFVSAEGIQGWANRTAAQSRLHVTFMDLTTNNRNNLSGLHISESESDAPDALKLRAAPAGGLVTQSITQVKVKMGGQDTMAQAANQQLQ